MACITRIRLLLAKTSFITCNGNQQMRRCMVILWHAYSYTEKVFNGALNSFFGCVYLWRSFQAGTYTIIHHLFLSCKCTETTGHPRCAFSQAPPGKVANRFFYPYFWKLSSAEKVKQVGPCFRESKTDQQFGKKSLLVRKLGKPSAVKRLLS